MDPEINEDCRPLREFYPEAEIRQQVHYAFAHQFLPSYVRQNPRAFLGYLYEGNMDPVRFIQSRWNMMEEQAGLVERTPIESMVFRRVTDLDLWIQTIDGQPGVFVEMPLPERPPLAFFVGVVLLTPVVEKESWPDDVGARYFTLERVELDAQEESAADVGIVCEWTATSHNNLGVLIRTDRDEFSRIVSKALANDLG